TFASRLVMAGVDLRTVQELMGHKTVAMTLRYSHLSPKHQLNAVQRLVLLTAGRSVSASDTSTNTSEIQKIASQGACSEVIDLSAVSGGPSETRTPDPLIKSQLLYQLS